ncbi:MAG: GNAT family N-acetyltransferase [Defluviitaleaceae bacterium]|nr:GNAT family N-acetyltransferase [Defluviitaleaceae bacterium]
MNSILPENINCIVVSPQNKESLDKFQTFYHGVYREAFPNQDECESYENFINYIHEYGSGKLYVHILIFYTGDDIVGGMVIDYFDDIKTMAIEFIVVAKKYQRQGLARKMMKYTEQYLINRHNKEIEWTIIEVENPKLVPVDENSNIYFWDKCKFKTIDFTYIQPALSPAQKPVEILLLCAYHHFSNAGLIGVEHVKAFLKLYSHYAMGIADPLGNPTIVKMFEALDKKNTDTIDLIDLKEFMNE